MNHRHATHEHGEGQQPEPQSLRPLAIPAALISLFAPGLGHLLIGMRARAIAWLGGYVAFAVLVAPQRPGAIWLVPAAAAVDALALAMTLPPPADNEAGHREDVLP